MSSLEKAVEDPVLRAVPVDSHKTEREESAERKKDPDWMRRRRRMRGLSVWTERGGWRTERCIHEEDEVRRHGEHGTLN